MLPINEQTPDDFSNEDSLISDYLNGYLTESEKIAFEKRLLEDSNFAKEVEFQKELALAVRMQERQRLKKSLKEISLKNKAADFRKPVAAIITPAASKGLNIFSIAAAVTVVVVSGVSLIIYLNSNSDLPTTNSTLSKNEKPIFNSKVNPTDETAPLEKVNAERSVSSKEIEQDKLNKGLASKIETKTVKVFPLKVTNEESFGFGSNSSKEIVVHIHRKTDSKSKNENQNAYMFWKNDLDIWINTNQDIKLYNLQEDYITDDDLEIKAGLYCRIGDDFYHLKDYNRIQPLIKESKEVNSYLLNQK
jgi:anti-sigma-K factor RskA